MKNAYISLLPLRTLLREYDYWKQDDERMCVAFGSRDDVIGSIEKAMRSLILHCPDCTESTRKDCPHCAGTGVNGLFPAKVTLKLMRGDDLTMDEIRPFL